MWLSDLFIGMSGTKTVYRVMLIVTTVHCHDGRVSRVFDCNFGVKMREFISLADE